MTAAATAALGFGILCGLAPLAQAVRIRIKRSAEDVSLLWLVLYGCGAASWLAYGAVEGSAPLLVSQTVALTSVVVTLVLAVRARRRVRRRDFWLAGRAPGGPEEDSASAPRATNGRPAPRQGVLPAAPGRRGPDGR